MSLLCKFGALQIALGFQWLPSGLISAYQFRKLKSLLKFCEQHIPLYQQKFRDAGIRAADLLTLQDLAHFPVTTREEIVSAYPSRLLARPPKAGDIIFRTSGTSGLFMEIAYSESANDFLDAVYARALFNTGYRPWHRFAYFWWEATPKKKTLYERFGLMQKEMMPVDPDPRSQFERLRKFKPDFIYHFPSSMRMLAQIARKQPDAGIHPRGIICHGEFMPREIQQEIAAAFQCPVWNQYGAQEFNRLGWDCALHTGLHLDADSVVLEVLDGDSPVPVGQPGDLVFTGLHNRLMPLIRYRIGDVGRLLSEPCPCGRTLPLFEVTEGRRDDLVLLADGTLVGPRVLAPRIEALPGFHQYRLIQKAVDCFEVLLVRDPLCLSDPQESLRRILTEVLGEKASITICDVTEIPLTARGKLRKIVSEISVTQS